MIFSHDKDIIARALGNEAFGIEQNRFFATGVVRFDLRQYIIQVIERFNRGVHGAMKVPDGGHGDNLHPVLVKFRRVKLDFIGNDDD